MDMIILILSVLSGLVVVFLFYFVFKVHKSHSDTSQSGNLINENDNTQQQAGPRRAIGTRSRMRGAIVSNRSNIENVNNQAIENDDDSIRSSTDDNNIKIGTKKRAKLEAKAEKKAQREVELKMREQRKKQQEKEEIERKLKEEKEKLLEEKLENEERRLQEEKERKEEEEYQKMKEGFIIEEAGFDEQELEQENLLEEFISHIKKKKVVLLEEIAAEFNLKIQSVISRIEDLLASGTLTGVIDDRGKFIYITLEELQAVADFIKKRGCVSVQELIDNSNKLIVLD